MTEKIVFEVALDKADQEHYAASAAHSMNQVYCAISGDFSQLSWDKAPEWQRKSCLAGVMAVLKDPTITPEDQHEIWRQHKADEGWIYGKVKNVEEKTHPCMVPYAELPDIQKAKDSIFGATVRGILGLMMSEKK